MKFTHSIHWRLLLWIAFLLGAVLLALDFTAYTIQFNKRVSQLDAEMKLRLTLLSAAFAPPEPGNGRPDAGLPGDAGNHPGPPPDMPGRFDDFPPDRPDGDRRSGPPQRNQNFNATRIAAAAQGLNQEVAAGFYYSIWMRDTAAPYLQSTNCPAGLSHPALPARNMETHTRTRDGFREVYHAVAFDDCVLVGSSLASVKADARNFAGWLGLGSAVVLLLGIGGARFIVNGALRPVEKISAAAVKISSGDLSQRISVAETESELGQLAGVLNSAFARLEAAFAQQKQFTADAAHELRTPLAVLISESQLALARERTVADYQEALAMNLETAQQMRRLADSLLELARFDAGQENLKRENTDLSVIVGDCVKFIIPLADARQVRIFCDATPTRVFADPERLARVITNLLANAIQYNRADGEIRVTVRVEDVSAVLTVADTGCGMAREDLPRVFERFYRANKSRAGGHTGLGLAICKSIVEAHGGTIEATSEMNIGSTFTVRLPVSSGRA
jgi:two-component system, OmpR family, sensor kinase